MGIVVARDNAGGPDLLGAVGFIVGIDFSAKALIDRCHSIALKAPVSSAEEVDAIEDAEQGSIDTFCGPDCLVTGINLAANRCPLGEGAAAAEGVPEEEDRFALPVEEVWIIAVMRNQVLQPTNDLG